MGRIQSFATASTAVTCAGFWLRRLKTSSGAGDKWNVIGGPKHQKVAGLRGEVDWILTQLRGRRLQNLQY